MHTGGKGERGAGTSRTPWKDFEQFGHKSEMKHENKGPPKFSNNLKHPPQMNLKMTVHVWLGTINDADCEIFCGYLLLNYYS